jgi:hypothetical protein
MPYGIDKSMGGDNPANVKFMEACVKAVKGKIGKDGKVIDEGSAVAICKTTLKRHKEKMKRNKTMME